MILLSFRAGSVDFDAVGFVKAHALKTGSVWSKGDRRRNGSVFEDSGFSLDMDEQVSWLAAVGVLESFFESKSALLGALRTCGATLKLHIGVLVGEETIFAAHLVFPTKLLQKFVSDEISLEVSAYPASDA